MVVQLGLLGLLTKTAKDDQQVNVVKSLSCCFVQVLEGGLTTYIQLQFCSMQKSEDTRWEVSISGVVRQFP